MLYTQTSSLPLLWEGGLTEIQAAALPSGILDAHVEGEQRDRRTERTCVCKSQKRKKREKVKKKRLVGVRWTQQPMVCLRAATASRTDVQQTEERHVCPTGRDWKTGSKSRQGNLLDTHCIKATRLIWKRGKKGKRRRKGELRRGDKDAAQSRVYLSGTPVLLG